MYFENPEGEKRLKEELWDKLEHRLVRRGPSARPEEARKAIWTLYFYSTISDEFMYEAGLEDPSSLASFKEVASKDRGKGMLFGIFRQGKGEWPCVRQYNVHDSWSKASLLPEDLA